MRVIAAALLGRGVGETKAFSFEHCANIGGWIMSLVDCQDAAKRRAEEIARDIRLGKRPPPKSNVFPIRPEPVAADPQPEPAAPPPLVIPPPEPAAKLDAIDDLESIPAKTIVLTVCKYYGILYRELVSSQRHQAVMTPRHVAMYLLHELPLSRRSYPEIGRAIGRRDHSTAFYSVRKITRLIGTEPDLASDVAQLRSLLEPSNV